MKLFVQAVYSFNNSPFKIKRFYGQYHFSLIEILSRYTYAMATL